MLISNLSVTTITVYTKIDNISFNEQSLSQDTINTFKELVNLEGSHILLISSNYMTIESSDIKNYNIKQNKNKSENKDCKKRGRQKKTRHLLNRRIEKNKVMVNILIHK